jgi:hypothetical protein
VEHGVVGDVSGREFLPGLFDAVQHLGCDGDGVLHEFFGVLCADRFDGLRHEGAKSWSDLFNEQTAC